MKKNRYLLLLIPLVFIPVFLYLYFTNQNQFVTVSDRSNDLNLSVEPESLELFVLKSLSPGDSFVLDHRQGEWVQTSKLKQIQIILSDDIQEQFSVTLNNESEPRISSSLEIDRNKLIIWLHINDEFVTDENGGWLLSTLIAHNIHYVRDISKFGMVRRAEIEEYYRGNIPTAEARQAINIDSYFAVVSKQ